MTSQAHDSPWQRSDGSALPNQPRPGSASLVDPEEDLPTAGDSSDVKTTTIPPYGATSNPNSGFTAAGYGQLGGAESPSYSQPHSGGRHAAPGLEEFGADDGRRPKAADRRGTQDLGLLILRVGLGALLVVHGIRKLFGWWGGQGLTGFKNSLSDTGYQYADILSYVAVGGQIVAGLLLVLGLFTPLAAAGALAYQLDGVLAGVSTDGGVRHFAFFLPGGHEYQIALIGVAAAIVLTGPGRYGFDAARGWSRRPFIGSFVALLLGIGGGIALWVLLNGANPLI
jgi:putative oxidoreductase